MDFTFTRSDPPHKCSRGWQFPALTYGYWLQREEERASDWTGKSLQPTQLHPRSRTLLYLMFSTLLDFQAPWSPSPQPCNRSSLYPRTVTNLQLSSHTLQSSGPTGIVPCFPLTMTVVGDYVGPGSFSSDRL